MINPKPTRSMKTVRNIRPNDSLCFFASFVGLFEAIASPLIARKFCFLSVASPNMSPTQPHYLVANRDNEGVDIKAKHYGTVWCSWDVVIKSYIRASLLVLGNTVESRPNSFTNSTIGPNPFRTL